MNTRSPIVIGGVGGSGTRSLAELVEKLGVHIGPMVNPALDNLWFTLIFKRPLWAHTFPSNHALSESLQLFEKAICLGLKNNIYEHEKQLIKCLADEWDNAKLPIGSFTAQSIAQNLLGSTGLTASSAFDWGWKEPNTHIFLPALAAHFPKLKYIHLIRNGLDMSYSSNQNQIKYWIHCKNLYTNDGFIENARPPDCNFSGINIELLNKMKIEPMKSLNYWISSNLRALEIGKSMRENSFLVVKYEDLCLNPTQQVNAIAEFLAIPENTVDITSLTSSIKPSNSIGRHQDFSPMNLSATQRDAIERIGYPMQ